MRLDTKYEHCDGCGGSALCAVVADRLLCGDCGNAIHETVGEEDGRIEALENERDDLKSSLKDAEEDRDEAKDEEKLARQSAEDARTELDNERHLTSEYANKIQSLTAEVEKLRAAPVVAPADPSLADEVKRLRYLLGLSDAQVEVATPAVAVAPVEAARPTKKPRAKKKVEATP